MGDDAATQDSLTAIALDFARVARRHLRKSLAGLEQENARLRQERDALKAELSRLRSSRDDG